jgi:integrase
MPRTRRPKPLYQRGQFALYAREGRNLEIVCYDAERGRERIASAGTKDVEAGRTALDRHYLRATGGEYVPPTNRTSPLVSAVIADYQLARGDEAASSEAIRHRLAHVVTYLGTLPDKAVRCDAIDERWIARFRTWLGKQAIRGSKRERSPATIENSVLQLAAAIRWARQIPAFNVIPLTEVTRSPEFRATIPQLAAMFRYAMETPRRKNLLAFLRLSVATWGRPDAILDASTAKARGQWKSQARAFDLNPVGRRQTKKRRPLVPVPECVGEWLDTINGPVVPDQVSKATWRRMEAKLGLPGQGQSGMKCVRRSVATLARPLIGERDWDSQGKMMLGHRLASTSDIYALPDPAHFGVALAATKAIIDQIDQLAPGSFYRTFTAESGNVVSLKGKLSV